jgi:diguanylate cyclase (GGDEF)-like protein
MTSAHTLAAAARDARERARAVAFPRVRWAYLLAFAPFLTDWIDSGRLPVEPREWVTELVLGMLISVVVWHLYASRDRYRALAERDSLTGLWNRRRFEDDLARAAQRAKPNVVLAYVDLTRFKAVNDQFGHEVGDVLLRTLATTMVESTRAESDRCYRLGGDEFAVLFENTDSAGAQLVLDRIAGRFRDNVFAQPTSCVVSFGIAEFTDAAPEEVVRRADAAMYESKRDSQRAFGGGAITPRDAQG